MAEARTLKVCTKGEHVKSLCVRECLSHYGIVGKQLNVGSCK